MLKQKPFILLILMTVALPIFADDDSVTEIPEVSLSAKDGLYQIDLSSGQTKSINRKEIQQIPHLKLSDFLNKQNTVRVSLNSASNSQYSLSFRGFGDNATANSLILIDGFPLINSSLLPPDFNAFLLSDIEHMEIFQGSEGSLWGNQAVGGVLNIQTRLPYHPIAGVEIEEGSNNQFFVSAVYGNRLNDHFLYKFSGLSNKTDNDRKNDRYSQNQFSAEQIFQYDSGLFQLMEKGYNNSQEFPVGLTLSQFENNVDIAPNFQNNINAYTQIYQILNQQALNKEWDLETRFSHAEISRDGFYISPFTENQFLNWFNPKLIGSYNYAQWILGGVLQNSGYETSTTKSASIANSDEQDIYGQAKFQLQNWELTLGSRFANQVSKPQFILGNQIEYSDHVFVTEEGLSYKINQYWKAFLRRDGNFRFPKTNEEVWLPKGVTQLKPQTGVSYETGLDYQSSLQQFQLSLYRLDLKNEIAYDPTQTEVQPFGATHNFDPTLRKGISASDIISLQHGTTVNAGVDYVDAIFESGPFAGKQIPAVPTWNANAGLSIQFLPHWRTSYEESYHGSSYASNDVLNKSRKAFVYWVGDWSVEYLTNHMRLAFSINNVFNKTYARYTLYNGFSNSNLYYPALGRTAMVSFNFDLS